MKKYSVGFLVAGQSLPGLFFHQEANVRIKSYFTKISQLF
jgi:hypothetical protein